MTDMGVFNFETKTVQLNSGYEMPIMGLGTYALDYDTCVNSVKTLLQNGGRLIDTAYMYGNEEETGNAIAKSGIPREEIFLTSKVWIEHYGYMEKARLRLCSVGILRGAW